MLTWIEISARALTHNIELFKKLTHSSVQIMAIVKSNAYGHGSELVARLCEHNPHIGAFGTANLDEALVLLKTNQIKKPIFVLSFFDINAIAYVTQAQLNQIRLPAHSLSGVKQLYNALKKKHLRARIHIKIDTGTSRIGFFISELEQLVDYLKPRRNILIIEGIYTHFADSEEDMTFTVHQNKLLMRARDRFREAGFEHLITHSACTAATVQLADSYQFDMLRLGIGLYGLNPTKKIGVLLRQKTGQKLKPVMSWCTRLIQTKIIPKGASVGYGRTFTARQPTSIGIVPIGYADGYDRGLSNRGRMFIRKRACPVLGRICMNMTMINIHKNTYARTGNVVIILGGDGEASADSLARALRTINYEVVTRINPSIPRIETA